jgi:hypothetical protein
VTRISSALTIVNKKVFPAFWFGFLAIFVVTSLVTGTSAHDAMFIVVPAMIALVSYVLMKKLVWDLADEVYDCGDFLLVRNRGDEDRIALASVMNVIPSTFTSPPRITLRLASPGKWGTEVAFLPIIRFTANRARNAIAEDLMVRVDRARRSRAAPGFNAEPQA